ncbi:VWA domain-containing protein [Sulfurimonas crateris]|uniref:VWA domain-containing protein n=1 Tax=Sulfurimonas crateris TaxID=2574727 RepID=A0A4U2Z8G0_9BACT|nr:VWA domain-containing protein [Sulfurimonas crateris]TKI69241.1 VWA domain-containing protein [Sulfurimonas crateris]
MFDGIYFEFPQIASLIFLFLLCSFLCKMKLPSIYFPHTAEFLKRSVSASKTLLFLKWLGIAGMILALMSPVKDEPYELEPKEGYEIALILDASESMQAEGFDAQNHYLTRFDVVKEIVGEFVKERQNDNIGLVVFGAFSFIASPPTYDADILNKILSQLSIGMAGKYTALNTSLAQGVNLLKMGDSKTKIAILLTDGYSTPQIDKIPLDVAIDMAKKEGVKVYPIGIGMPHEYNQDVLLRIANESGGVAFGASNANELKEVYKTIDKLEKSEIRGESFTNVNYYYQFPLFISLLSLMLYVYLRNKRGYA